MIGYHFFIAGQTVPNMLFEYYEKSDTLMSPAIHIGHKLMVASLLTAMTFRRFFSSNSHTSLQEERTYMYANITHAATENLVCAIEGEKAWSVSGYVLVSVRQNSCAGPITVSLFPPFLRFERAGSTFCF